MRRFGVLFSILVKVSIDSLSHAESLGDVSSWIFPQDNQLSNTIPSPSIEENPCTSHEVRKPNFTTPDRRLATVKCFEYVWELKNRDDEKQRDKACREYRRRNRIGTNIHYIIGGRMTFPAEFPHMGALGWRLLDGSLSFKCGSSLISPRFTLTAAHCSSVPPRDTSLADTKPEIVRLGNKSIRYITPLDLVNHFTILQVIVHPQFAPPKKYNDIALVKLAKEVTFNKFVQPACLWTQHDTSELGEEAVVSGWGTIDAAGTKVTTELQAAVVSVVDSEECDKLLQPMWNRLFNGLQSHQMCAGVPAGGVDTCKGDSGGPLQVKIPLPIISEGIMSYIIGVTSFGIGCARAHTPGVYTRVSSFVDWIEDTVWRERNQES